MKKGATMKAASQRISEGTLREKIKMIRNLRRITRETEILGKTVG